MQSRRRLAASALLLLLLLGGAVFWAISRPVEPHKAPATGDVPTGETGDLDDAAAPDGRERAHVDGNALDDSTSADGADTDAPPVPSVPPVPDGTDIAGGPPTSGPVRTRREEPSGDDQRGGLRLRVDDGDGVSRDDMRAYVFGHRGGARERVHNGPVAAAGLTVSDLDPGWATVTVRVGSLTRTTRVRIEAGLITDVDLTIPRGATVTGTVRHREHGVLAKVHVNCGDGERGDQDEGEFRDTLFAIADDEGTFRFTGVPDGSYVLAFEGGALGFGLNPSSTLVVAGGRDTRHDVLLGWVSLQGVVIDAATRKPVAGAHVMLVSPRFAMTSTDAAGRYSFIDVHPGDYRMGVAHAGFGWIDTTSGAVADGRTLSRDFRMHAAARLVLDVRDDAGEPVVAIIALELTPAEGTAGTRVGPKLQPDARGRAVFDQAVAGPYGLTIDAPGYRRATLEVTLPADEPPLDVVLVRDNEAAPAPLLEGAVVDAETGASIAGARISLPTSPAVAVSGEDGRFRLFAIDAGTVSGTDAGPRPAGAFVGVDGYGMARFQVATSGPVEFRLQPAAELVLRFRSRDGSPLEGRVSLGVQARAEGGTNIGTSVEADAGGVATFHRVLPGRYTLRFSSRVGGKAELEAEIQPGRNELDVDLR